MPKITFAKGQSSIEAPKGSNLMKTLLEHNMPVASSCGSKLVCGKCYVEVLEGSENLSPISQEERDLMEIKNIPTGCRLSCSCTLDGDVLLDTPYW